MASRVGPGSGQGVGSEAAARRDSLSSSQGAAQQLLEMAYAQSLPGGLYLVATPIGNLADVTLRAIAVLGRADSVYCEDTRITRRLLDACGIKRRLLTYHEHNAAAVRPSILQSLADGAVVALVSDAGTPLISDPGYKLVVDALEAGYRVSPVPGPSALTAALSVAGLETDAVTFLGFLPQKSAARRQRLRAFAGLASTLILYEGPTRLSATLEDALETLGDRPAVVARELTKLHEAAERGTLSELVAWSRASKVKGEIAIVIGQSRDVAAIDDAAILARLEQVRAGRRLSDAARLTAEALGVSRQRVYRLGLEQAQHSVESENASET